jgi:hypothetical protein
VKRLAVALAVAIAAAVTAGPAAADTIARGAIVKIEQRELYLNLGSRQGVARGARLRLKRPIKLRHPVSRQWLTDWIPLGGATVTAAGDRLSMAVVDAELASQVALGDIAEIYVERDEPIDPATVAAPAAGGEPLPTVEPATARVLEVWRATTGLGLDQRIAAWELYVAADPDGPHAAALREDLALLRELREALRTADDTALSPALGGIEHAAPLAADGGRPIALAFLIDQPARLATAWLHYRTAGESTYQRLLLGREGELYLRGAIPGEVVRAPGVEYFVEIATSSGEVGTAVAAPERPVAVAVAGPTLSDRFGGERRRSAIALRTSYVDFASLDDRPGNRSDFFYQLEADVLYRLDGPLWGVRVGAGSIQGEGGYADRVYPDDGPAPVVGFNYGYAEAELAAAPRVGAAVRMVAGVGQRGFGVGLEGRLRLGQLDETNLSLMASGLAEVGFLSELRLEVQALDRLPLGLAAAVTDQPSNGDLGVRLSTDVGWRATDWFSPTVRLSYQARTIDHGGLGAGLALVMGW